MSLMNDNGILKTAIGTYYNYVDVNNDQNLRKMMVKYYQDKTLKWLKKDYIEITNCFEVVNNKLKKKNCNTKSKDLDKVAIKIFDMIEEKEIIKKILLKYTKLYEINWYDLKLEKKLIKKLIKKIIKKKILSKY